MHHILATLFYLYIDFKKMSVQPLRKCYKVTVNK